MSVTQTGSRSPSPNWEDQWDDSDTEGAAAATPVPQTRHPAEQLTLTCKIIVRIQRRDDPELLKTLQTAERQFDELLAFFREQPEGIFQLMLPKPQLERFTEHISIGYQKLGDNDSIARIRAKYLT